MNGAGKVHGRVYIVGGSEISHHMDCCVYLIDAGELVLVDAGAGQSTGRLLDNIQSLGFLPEKLSTIIVTHAHIDHIGSLAELKQATGARIIAHEADSAAIESGIKVGAEQYGVAYKPCLVDEKLKGDRSTLQAGDCKIDIIHIPGHTPGSIALLLELEGKKVLFGQDIHGPYHPVWGGEPEKALASLSKLHNLRADILCEGHYEVIRPEEEVDSFIQEFIDGLSRGR